MSLDIVFRNLRYPIDFGHRYLWCLSVECHWRGFSLILKYLKCYSIWHFHQAAANTEWHMSIPLHHGVLPIRERVTFIGTILAHPEFALRAGRYLHRSPVIPQWKHHKQVWMCKGSHPRNNRSELQREGIILSNTLIEFNGTDGKFLLYFSYMSGWKPLVSMIHTAPQLIILFTGFIFICLDSSTFTGRLQEISKKKKKLHFY